MAKKQDFSGANTGRVYGNLEQTSAMRGKQPKISPQELAERTSEMRTQGRAGAKLPRVNMAFSPENFDYVKVVSGVMGMSMTRFTNWIIEQYREVNPELYEKAKALKEEAQKSKT